jgi:hypothetical protein
MMALDGRWEFVMRDDVESKQLTRPSSALARPGRAAT